jgi:hypothetical protein
MNSTAPFQNSKKKWPFIDRSRATLMPCLSPSGLPRRQRAGWRTPRKSQRPGLQPLSISHQAALTGQCMPLQHLNGVLGGMSPLWRIQSIGEAARSGCPLRSALGALSDHFASFALVLWPQRPNGCALSRSRFLCAVGEKN